MKYSQFNRSVLANAFNFYARTLTYPYDELTHELQHIFREMEKNIENAFDNTITARILDIINHYQGEEMKALQAEYTRLFTPRKEIPPVISLQLQDWTPMHDLSELEELLFDVGVSQYSGEHPDFVTHVLEYFASALDYEEEPSISNFYEKFLQEPIPKLCATIYQKTTLTFYKEIAKGLHDLIHLMAEAQEAPDIDSIDLE
ncbi:nitrate reductase molybdenum cofactor assembly chaperone [Caldithrix abyssi]